MFPRLADSFDVQLIAIFKNPIFIFAQLDFTFRPFKLFRRNRSYFLIVNHSAASANCARGLPGTIWRNEIAA